ncbi:hypothetical protein KSP39_PZI023143 [Platanthera zijinensis]|uniref:Uncharacterized protein n=1 Tax=Platanthera zijinensis TaxID=2320716 RepID=A0AAP0AUH9_9ASPA
MGLEWSMTYVGPSLSTLEHAHISRTYLKTHYTLYELWDTPPADPPDELFLVRDTHHILESHLLLDVHDFHLVGRRIQDDFSYVPPGPDAILCTSKYSSPHLGGPPEPLPPFLPPTILPTPEPLPPHSLPSARPTSDLHLPGILSPTVSSLAPQIPLDPSTSVFRAELITETITHESVPSTACLVCRYLVCWRKRPFTYDTWMLPEKLQAYLYREGETLRQQDRATIVKEKLAG